MKRITPEEGNHAVKVSSSGEFLLDTYSSLVEPRRTVLRDRSGKELKEIHKAPDPLAEKRIGITEVY